MTSFEDLFGTGGSFDNVRETIWKILFKDLFSFKDHPFKVLNDESM